MRIQKLLGTTITIFLMSLGTTYAATVADGDYAISYTATAGNGPSYNGEGATGFTFNWSNNTGTFSETLPLSETSFFSVSPAGSSGCNFSCDYTASGTITVTFSSMELIVGGNTYTSTQSSYQDTAAYIADYNNDTDSVTWTSSVVPVTFTNGEVLDIKLYNASDWTIDPEISLTVSQTPLPAALPLFLGGLSVMGVLGWRRRRKAAAV